MPNQLLQSVLFACTKHEDQRRKNSNATPYINHPVEVAEYLSRVGGVDDVEILVAAILHDTIEDTNTTAAEIRECFGDSVLGLVLECTDDKSLEKSERKRLQIENASQKSPGAKQIKLADKACNLKSILVDPPKDWTISRQIDYFEWAKKVCDGLTGVNEKLDEEINQILDDGIRTLTDRLNDEQQ